MSTNSKSKKRVTLAEVADHAHVSMSTVSLVIRNNPRISEATRQRVLTSIDTLGYVYHRAAASMRSQASHTVGLMIPTIENAVYAELTAGIEASLEQSDYALLLSDSAGHPDKQTRVMRTMMEHWIDGILICPAPNTSPILFEKLQKQNIPAVMVIHHLPHIETDYVGADTVEGAYRAVTHFIEQGHTRIAFLGGPPDVSSRQERLAGYQKALADHQIEFEPALVLASAPNRREGYQAFERLVQQVIPLPTAILCYNDVIAFGVMLAIQAAGLRVGQDIAVIGFDNIEEAELWTPSLSTVAISPRQLGMEAAQLLIERIRDPERPIEKKILPAELVIRESCGALGK